MKRTFLSMGVVALLAANTYGAGSVWWEVTSTAGGAGIGAQGAAGADLLLTTDGTASSWNISVMFASADGGSAGWALDYMTAAADVSISNEVFPSNLLNAITTPGIPGTSPGEIFTGSNGFTFMLGGIPAGLYTLHTFTLTLGAGQSVADIYAAIGGAEFGGDDTVLGYEIVRLGSNAFRTGTNEFAPGGGTLYEPAPVIRITPEPSTLALLAISGLALIRRRK